MVAAMAEQAQTPVDLPALASLAVLSAAALGTTIECRGGWTEQIGLYLIVAMPSGERKSTVLRAVTKPLLKIEQELRDTEAARVDELQDRREALELGRKALTRDLSKA